MEKGTNIIEGLKLGFAGLVVVVVMVLMLSACSNSEEEVTGNTEQGTTSDVNLTTENSSSEEADMSEAQSAYSSGDWMVDDTGLDTSINVSYEVISDQDLPRYNDGNFQLLTNPVHLSANDQENVRLPESIMVTINLEDALVDQLKNNEIPMDELFFAYYYDGIWEPYMPLDIDLEAKTATIEVYHFSNIGFGRVSIDQEVKAYTDAVAVANWERDERYKAYQEAAKDEFDKMFTEMGVQSSATKIQLMADVISYVDETGVGYFDFFAQSMKSGATGNKLDMENKYKEFLGKAIYAALEKDAGDFAGKANFIGNLASAAGSIAGGDNKAALEALANFLNNSNPAVQLATTTSKFVSESVDAAIDYWTTSEVEKAYQVYKNGVGGKWGYEDGLEGDFNTIFTTLGGADRQLDIKVIAKYCQRHGIDASSLSYEERNDIIDRAKAALKASFDRRIVEDQAIAEYKAKEEKFWTEVKKADLLSPETSLSFFGDDYTYGKYDIATRIALLNKVKTLVLGIMDEDVASTISDAELAKVMSQWIYWTEKKDREGFYKYMRDLGYIKDPLLVDGGFWKRTQVVLNSNDEAWAQANTSTVYTYEPTCAEGSYSLKWTYIGKDDDYYDPPYKHGESFSVQGTHGIPPEVLIPESELNIDIGVEITANSLSAYYPSGSIRGWIGNSNFTTKEGQYMFGVDKDVAASRGILTTTVPKGSPGAEYVIEFVFYATNNLGTKYIYTFTE